MAARTASSVTLNPVPAPGNGQTVEYAAGASDAAPATGWQDAPTFDGLGEYTQYHFFARAKQDANHRAGNASSGTAIRTADATAPTGWVAIKGTKFDSFPAASAHRLFFRGTAQVTVGGDDTGSGVNSVEYHLSTAALPDTTDWDDVDWTTGGTTDVPANWTGFVFARVADNAGNATVVGSDGIVLYTDSAPATTQIGYVKGTATDQTAIVNLNGNSIRGVANGADTLVEGDDYTVDANEITFKGSYLEGLALGGYSLAVSYNPGGVEYVEAAGNDRPGTTAIALTVGDTPPAVYALTVANGTGSGSYAAGAAAPISADAPPAGKVFDKWTGGNGGAFADAGAASTTFTMPANAATVTATYKDAPAGFVPVTAISGVPTAAVAGEALTLTGTVQPSDATNTAITWSLKDAGDTGATLSGATLETTAPGVAVVTATVVHGASPTSDYTQDFAITVAAGPSSAKDVVSVAAPSGAVVDGDTISGAVPNGRDSVVVDLEVSEGASWKLCRDAACSDEIPDKTLSPLAVGANTAYVEVTAEDGTVKVYTLTVERADPSAVPVSGIAVTGEAAITAPGGVLQLEASVRPADATNKSVAWSSSNAGVASVDADGKVTAVSDGTVVIRATARDGSGVFGEITITVTGQRAGPSLYPVIDHFGTWDGSGDAIGKVDADHTKFTRLLRAGVEIAAAHYTVTSGSTVITLKEAYLATLAEGAHSFVAEFTDGVSEEIQFDVAPGGATPTEDPTPGPTSSATAGPGTGLPFTGSSGGGLGFAAVVLMAAGACLLAGRRRWRLRES
jgi:uncharacterized protein YjdB